MTRIEALCGDLAARVAELWQIEKLRDEMTREANNLMIRHHNVSAEIARIHVEIVSENDNGTK